MSSPQNRFKRLKKNRQKRSSFMMSLRKPKFRKTDFFRMQNLEIPLIRHGGTPERQGKGRWAKSEQYRYIQFLKANKEILRSKVQRKSYMVFSKMSKIIQTRSSAQCRSHHQKLLKIHHSIENIIHNYQSQKYESPGKKQIQIINLQPLTTHQIVSDLCTIKIKENSIRIEIDEWKMEQY